MPRCPECKTTFRVLEDEDDGSHPCPHCGYGEDACEFCGSPTCLNDCPQYFESLEAETEEFNADDRQNV